MVSSEIRRAGDFCKRLITATSTYNFRLSGEAFREEHDGKLFRREMLMRMSADFIAIHSRSLVQPIARHFSC